MVLPISYVAEWEQICKNKQKIIDKNNHRENSTRVDYDYVVGQLVILRNTDIQCKLDNPTTGPYKILQVYTNGNVSILRGSVI